MRRGRVEFESARDGGMDKRVTERELPGEGVSSAAEALNLRASKGLNGAKILVLGVAYKRNVEDIRESRHCGLSSCWKARARS